MERSIMPLAAFPKCFVEALTLEKEMKLDQWIEMRPIPVTDSFSSGFEQFPKLRKDRSKTTKKEAFF